VALWALVVTGLARGLDGAPRRGRIIVNMKDDWKVIFPFEKG
jgi:hypothetical protein